MPIERLSGKTYFPDKPPFCLDIRDVPKVLLKYIELHDTGSDDSKQAQYNRAAQKLATWFEYDIVRRFNKYVIRAQKIFKDYFDFSLPDDWDKVLDNADETLAKLQLYPFIVASSLCYCIKNLALTPEASSFADTFSVVCENISDERDDKISHLKLKVIPIDDVAKSFTKRESPNGTELDFYFCNGSDKIFLHAAQVAVACGASSQSGATSDNTDLSKAVAIISRYYSIANETKGKSARFIDFDDAARILHEYYFFVNHYIDRNDIIADCQKWFLELDKHEIEDELKQFRAKDVSKTTNCDLPLSEFINQVSINTGVRKAELIQAICDIKAKNLEKEISALKELLA